MNTSKSKDRDNAIWRDGAAGDEMVDKYLGFLQELSDRNIRVAVIHPNYLGDTPIPAPNPVGLKRYRKLVSFCEKHNMVLAIENLEINDQLEYLLANISGPALRVLFDIGHANCFTHDTYTFPQKHADRIIATHLHNNWGKDYNDEHNDLDNGNIDFAKFFAIKTACAYHTLEIKAPHVKTVKQFEKYVKHNVEFIIKLV